MNSLPPISGRIAVALGFLSGTWTLVEGLHRLITGAFVRIPGYPAPWMQVVRAVGLNPAEFGLVLVVTGIALLVASNLYLFQNREAAWKFLLVTVIVSSWHVGLTTPLLLAQVGLLISAPVRRGLVGVARG